MKLATMLLASSAMLVWAGDPWKDKKPAEWNEKDSAKVLTNSPWAKTVYGEMSGGGMGGGRGGAGSMSGGGGGSGRRGGGGGGGGAAGGGGGEDSPGGGGGGNMGPAVGPSGPKVTVRWETSEVMLEAFNRVEYSLLPKLREWSKEFYVVTAAGMPVRMGGGRPQQPGGPQQQGDRPQMDPKQMMERFIQGTTLKRKGKEPIHPVRIEMLRAGDQMVPMFFFPKSDAIVADDKEVAFESAFGPATIKAKFNLKDMLYEGKLAL